MDRLLSVLRQDLFGTRRESAGQGEESPDLYPLHDGGGRANGTAAQLRQHRLGAGRVGGHGQGVDLHSGKERRRVYPQALQGQRAESGGQDAQALFPGYRPMLLSHPLADARDTEERRDGRRHVRDLCDQRDLEVLFQRGPGLRL